MDELALEMREIGFGEPVEIDKSADNVFGVGEGVVLAEFTFAVIVFFVLYRLTQIDRTNRSS